MALLQNGRPWDRGCGVGQKKRKEEKRSVAYKYQLPMRNTFIIYYKHIEIKFN